MKNLLTLFFLFVLFSVKGQELRKIINGKVTYKKSPISDVHVINMNTNIGTTTNDKGFFEIPIIVGDSLFISHLNFKIDTVFISKDINYQKTVNIELSEKTNTLEEFTLGKQKNIFELYNDIKRYEGPKVNAISLGLPYAKTKAKKNKAIVSFQSGGILSLDNLINSINGKKRQEKIIEKLSLEDSQLKKIRKHFTDNFFIVDLMIRKENINPFLNYCFKKNIIPIFQKKEFIKLTRILLKESKIFPQKAAIDSLVIINN
ncbi:carboxypeptidase-like regulatory domain-containing protein [Polaribacter sp. MSW13]|uniref:Carboxypeptidase-like regulatory domain-containing protein n=1 Tax=Polaribacter marinus TaxID=2916838 RepID=A0A9X2AIF3_9FLAO|nr:carboxypeptidase-like regulatory domain-containing protein [Polaribacter marinus]MCI2228027.1 carboxypeptidase-like regulatory domain-containing protein [Polaribacter marinus]